MIVAVARAFNSPPLADIAATKIAAIIRPTRPIGMRVVMKVGNT